MMKYSLEGRHLREIGKLHPRDKQDFVARKQHLLWRGSTPYQDAYRRCYYQVSDRNCHRQLSTKQTLRAGGVMVVRRYFKKPSGSLEGRSNKEMKVLTTRHYTTSVYDLVPSKSVTPNLGNNCASTHTSIDPTQHWWTSTALPSVPTP